MSIKIPCTLIPVKRFNLVLPNSAVAEVISRKEINQEKANQVWLLGTIEWQNDKIPVIEFDKIDEADQESEYTKYTIIIVRNCLPGNENNNRIEHFGILAKSMPQVIEANAHSIGKELHPQISHSQAKSYLTFHGKAALIPDIESIVRLIYQQSDFISD